MVYFTDKLRMQNSKKINIYLYFAATIVNVTSFSSGITAGWSSPEIPKLKNQNSTPLSSPMTYEEESWIASLLPLAALIGPLTAGYLMDKIGRKKTLILALIWQIVAFLTCAFATNVDAFYVGRILMGVALGTVLSVVPIYIGEIAELRNRGILGCFMVEFMTLGILFCYSVGPYTSIFVLNLTCVMFPVLCFIFILFVPESPYYLIAKNQEEDAKSSLLKFRYNDIDIVNEEIVEIQRIVKESLKGDLSDVFKDKGLIKGLIVVVVLIALQQLSGVTLILFFLQSIFQISGGNIPSDISSIIVGIVQCIGVSCASLVVDKFGRKILLILSCLGTCFMLMSLGTYIYLKEHSKNVEALAWLPLTCLMVYIALYNLGLGPLPYTVLGEMFPPHVKAFVSTVTVCICLIISFCTVKFFPLLSNVIGVGCTFWIFGLIMAAGVLFTVALVPETKGKTLDEIQMKLRE